MFKLLLKSILFSPLFSRGPDYGFSKTANEELLLKICNTLASLRVLKAIRTSGCCNSWGYCPGDEAPYINFYFCNKNVFGCNDPDGEWESYYEDYNNVDPF